jgi:hypothetical protein
MVRWELLEWSTDSAVGCWLEHIEGGCEVCKPTLGEGLSACEEGALLRDAALQELTYWPNGMTSSPHRHLANEVRGLSW